MKVKPAREIAVIAAIILYAGFIVCGTAYCSIRMYVNQFIADNYRRRTTLWRETAKHIPPGGIVFAGDSHTEYFALDEYFPELPVINRGIYGDTTSGVINRLDESVLNLNPSKVFLLIGANDINKTRETDEGIVENIRTIVRKIRSNNQKAAIYVQSLYPVNPNGKNSKRIDIFKITNSRIASINRLLEALCRDENIVYIDMFTPLSDENGQLQEQYTIEGLHLSAAGYSFIAEILRPYVE
jgi:lysophospholipase L1-like esterase